MDDGNGNYLPLDNPKRYHSVFAVIDSAVKYRQNQSWRGRGVLCHVISFDPPIAILDWDLKQIEGGVVD